MSTIAKTVNLDAGLAPNYAELDPDFTDDMDDFELAEFSNSTLMRLIGYCGREEYIEEQKENPDQDRLKNWTPSPVKSMPMSAQLISTTTTT